MELLGQIRTISKKINKSELVQLAIEEGLLIHLLSSDQPLAIKSLAAKRIKEVNKAQSLILGE